MRYEDEITIKVGFGVTVRELKVRIPEGDLPPYQVGDEFSLLGTSPDRVDAAAKVTGRARYTSDRKLPGMLHARIVHATVANADIATVDVSKAEKMPGVKAVITFPELFRTRSVRFAWQGVAAVAAETEAQAEEAARAVEVTYEKVLPFAVTKEAAMAQGAPQVGRGNQENVVTQGRRRGESEDDFKDRLADQRDAIDAALKKSHVVVEGTFETQVQVHNALETHGVVCDWDGDDLLCYASTQGTFSVQQEATSGRGLVRARAARVITEYVGGGFGAKFGLGQEGVAGAMLAKEAGRPVRLMLDRREEQTMVGNRPDSLQKLAIGLSRKGKIKALRAYSWGTAGISIRGAGARNNVIYDVEESAPGQPLIDKVEHGVRTNCGGARAFRAPGWPQGVFALESLLDMAADELGIDALELRKRNDSHPIRQAEWDMGAERIDWRKKRNRRPGRQPGPVKSGVGCAATTWFQAGGARAACVVRIHKNGEVEVRNGAQDIGTGTRTIMGMVAAEELGLPLERVQTFIGDTNDPIGPASGGSTTIGTLTPAVRLAAHSAKGRLLDLVAGEHGLKADDLDLLGGEVVRKDGRKLAKTVTFEQACGLMAEEHIEANERRPVFARRPGERRVRANYDGFANTNAGAQFAEVEVDTETGNVRVKKIVAVQDSGKILNAKTAESQVRGGVIGGLGYALLERRVMDRHEGRMLNADLENYKIVGAKDVPEIDVVLLDVYNGRNNTSVMGLGEPPKVATAAAIANAVANAIGVRIHSLPITPAKVLQALASKEKK